MDIVTAMDTETTTPLHSATEGRWIAGFAASAPTGEPGALTPSGHATSYSTGPGDDDEDDEDDDDDRPGGDGGNIDPDDDEGYDDGEDDDDEEPLQVR